MRSFRLNLDALGACASSLCMIHCLVFPLLLAALPMLSLSTVAEDAQTVGAVHSPSADSRATEPSVCVDGACCATGPHTASSAGGADDACAVCCTTPTDFWIHVGLLAAVAPLGLVAWGAGCRQHRQWGVLGLGVVGVLLLSGALLFGHYLLGGRGEQVMTVAGSVCMVTAHLWNRRQCRCCRTPDLARLVEIELRPESEPVPVTDGGVS